MTTTTREGTTVRPRILLVDDEPAILDALGRHLRHDFDITTAPGGAAGIATMEQSDPFAVVVSDMRMPGMHGAAFLGSVRHRWPESVRVLLTGYADVEGAMAVVNEGQIFRFLLKPCEAGTLRRILHDAVEQHRLVTAERELLERTLHGSVRALLETLSLANPVAFSGAVRVRDVVGRILDVMQVENRWEIEVATMLAQMGAVTLPPAIAERLHQGLPLDKEEQAMVDRLPDLAERLLAEIPRLEGVRAIIHQQRRSRQASADAPLGAHVLRVATAFDALVARGISSDEALDLLDRQSPSQGYDADVLEGLRSSLLANGAERHIVEVELAHLEPGMILEADVRTGDGLLLVARGYPVTPNLLERIRNFSSGASLDPTVLVSFEPA